LSRAGDQEFVYCRKFDFPNIWVCQPYMDNCGSSDSSCRALEEPSGLCATRLGKTTCARVFHKCTDLADHASRCIRSHEGFGPLLSAIHLVVVHGHQSDRTREIRMWKELAGDAPRLIQVFPSQAMVASWDAPRDAAGIDNWKWGVGAIVMNAGCASIYPSL
jgi:hypothetical protein